MILIRITFTFTSHNSLIKKTVESCAPPEAFIIHTANQPQRFAWHLRRAAGLLLGGTHRAPAGKMTWAEPLGVLANGD